MKKVKDFSDLTCWKIAHEIRLEAYEVCRLLPSEEKYNSAVKHEVLLRK